MRDRVANERETPGASASDFCSNAGGKTGSGLRPGGVPSGLGRKTLSWHASATATIHRQEASLEDARDDGANSITTKGTEKTVEEKANFDATT